MFNRYSPIILLLLLLICSSCYALQGSTAEGGSNAAGLHQLGLTGKGINIGLLGARNVRNTHEAFNDSNSVHIFNFDFSGSGIDYMGGSAPGHDTWVAGIIASRGWTGHLNDIGAAPDCNIYSARVADNNNYINNYTNDFVEDALNALIDTYNCRIFVLPIQLSGYANGSSQYSLMLDYFAYTNDVIFALASGNGPTNVTVFGDAYNGITAGALIDEPNDFYLKVGAQSNYGPTVDGRKKPEITCPASSQTTASIWSDISYYTTSKTSGATSYAVPHTGGVAALLLQYADSTVSEPDDGHNEVIKAVIVNSAFPNIRDKSGNFTDPANQVWNAHRGYGRIDALRAYQTLAAGRITKNTTVASKTGWAYDTLGKNKASTHIYYIAGKKNERFVLTVVWNRAVKKSDSWYSVDTSRNFDIDLTVRGSALDILLTGSTDNLEKIDVNLPADGNYQVTVKNTTSIEDCRYGLAFEIIEPLTGDFDMDYDVDGNDLGRMALDWLGAGTDTDIVYDSSNIVNWRDFAEFANSWLLIEKRYHNP
ncbi:MAG: S8 family serine peptidase [Phycisphaerae bacterium]|nr:S8 family serine peptidase [Phycisphaerae bacterium]